VQRGEVEEVACGVLAFFEGDVSIRQAPVIRAAIRTEAERPSRHKTY